MAMSPKDKAKFQAEWKKSKNRKSGEILNPGSVARGVAKVALKVVGKELTKKATKGATAAQKKAYKEKVTIPAKKVVKEAKKELKIESKALKAANKPTKASKTFIGSNNNLSPSVRRDIIVNQTKPARPNRERGGSLKTLRKQGKTNPTPPRNKSK
jgi:hypothetical protein